MNENRINDLKVQAGLVAAGGVAIGGIQRSTLYHVDAFAPLTMDDLIGLVGLNKLNQFKRRVMKQVMERAGQLVLPVNRFTKIFKLSDLLFQPVWVEDFHNLVVNAGLDDSLDKHLKGSTYTAAWYVGLTTGSKTFAAADTMASHAGWTEFTNYTQGTHPALTLGTVASQSVNNSANKATYTIDTGGGTAGGAYITNNSAKSGSTGILYGGGAFSQDRTLLQGDTLNVTVTCTAAAS